MNEVVCEVCQHPNPAGAAHCEVCGNALPPAEAPGPGPGQESAEQDHPRQEHLQDPADEPARAASGDGEEEAGHRCWHCGLAISYHGSQRCRSCGQRVNPPPAVALRFPGNQVLVCDAGQSLALGRVGDHASVFVPYRNVSRRHARLIVDAEGTPWLDPVPDAPNGTFVDGSEIVRRNQLRDGQTVRFASQLAGIVVIPSAAQRQPPSQEAL